jgi:hypothetical protein
MATNLDQKSRPRDVNAATIPVVALLTLLAFALVVSAGCSAAKQSRRAHRARVDLAGITRTELQRCAGDPLRVERTGGWEYLTYVSPRREDQQRSTQCVATFMVRNGYVEDLDYENPSGGLIGTSIGECLAIVDPCLPKEKK